MIQKLSRNRLERRNTQSTLLLGGGGGEVYDKYAFVHNRGLATKPANVS